MFLVSMCPINFKANYIKPVNIKKQGEDYSASLIQIDKTNPNDIKALQKLAYSWGTRTYAYDVYINASDDYYALRGEENYSKYSDPSEYYAITKQKNNFDDLNYADILGITQLSNRENTNEIKYLQVEPKNSYYSKQRKYSHVGSTLIENIKQMFSDKVLFLYSNAKSISFYEKLGFVQNMFNELHNEMYIEE